MSDVTPVPLQDPVAVFFTTLISQLTTGVAPALIDSSAEAYAPFLAFPVVKEIFEWIVKEAATKLSIVEQEGALTIVFNVEADVGLYTIVQSLLNVQKAQATGDPDAISKSIQDAANQWQSIGGWGGTAPIIGA